MFLYCNSLKTVSKERVAMMKVGVNRKSAPDCMLGNAQTNPIQQVCPDIGYEKANIWRRKVEEKKGGRADPKVFSAWLEGWGGAAKVEREATWDLGILGFFYFSLSLSHLLGQDI